MKCTNLSLLGTLHLYREAGPALYELLTSLAPEVITVEISRFSLKFRQRAMPVWFTVLARNLGCISPGKREHAGIRLLVRQLRIPYEWTVANRYAANHGIRCIAVDMGDFARIELPAWHQELLSSENLEIIASEPDFDLQKHFSARLRFASMFLSGKKQCCEAAHPLSYLAHDQWQKRENKVSGRIQKIAALCSRTVHICGWTHLVTGSPWPSLSDMLMPLNPQRMLVPYERN